MSGEEWQEFLDHRMHWPRIRVEKASLLSQFAWEMKTWDLTEWLLAVLLFGIDVCVVLVFIGMFFGVMPR